MDLVDILYKKTIAVFMQNMENSEEIKNNYKEYLKKIYGHLNLNEIKQKNKLNVLISLEKERWQTASVDYKKSFILPDESLNKISKISAFAYEAAKNRFNNSVILNEEIDKYLYEMDKLCQNVYDFNIFLAKEYISEASIDLYYATGKSDNMSLRIGRIKENTPKK